MVDLNKPFLEAADIMELIGYKDVKCYRIIASLNNELKKQGYRVLKAKVSTEYFCKRYGIKPSCYEKPFLMKQDVMKLTGLGENLTYRIIRELNKELEDDGFLTHSARILTEKFYKSYRVKR